VATLCNEVFKQDCSAYNFAEVHQFPWNSVMEFSEYLKLDTMAHWPRFFVPPCILGQSNAHRKYTPVHYGV